MSPVSVAIIAFITFLAGFITFFCFHDKIVNDEKEASYLKGWEGAMKVRDEWENPGKYREVREVPRADNVVPITTVLIH